MLSDLFLGTYAVYNGRQRVKKAAPLLLCSFYVYHDVQHYDMTQKQTINWFQVASTQGLKPFQYKAISKLHFTL